MNPLRVAAENYRTYERFDLELPEGCTAIIGPNGAGKSSILNVIELALFGPANRRMETLQMQGAEGDLVLELTFEHRGELYRVRRRFTPTSRGKTTLDFERRVRVIDDVDLGGAYLNLDTQAQRVELAGMRITDAHDEWEPLTRTSMAETQAVIDATVELSRDTFRASAFLAQGDGAAFTEALPARRKEILAEVLGLSLWDRLLEETKETRAHVQGELTMVGAQLAAAAQQAENVVALEQELREASDDAEQAARELTKVQADLEVLRDGLAAAKEEQAKLREARLEHEQAEDAAERIRLEIAESDDAANELAKTAQLLLNAQGEAAALPEIERRLEEAKLHVHTHRQRVAERELHARQAAEHDRLVQAAQENVDAIVARMEEVESGETTFCDACGQPLDTQARAKALEVLRGNLATARARLTREVEEREEHAVRVPPDPGPTPSLSGIEELTSVVTAARIAAQQAAAHQARIELLRERVRDRAELQARSDAATDRLVDASKKLAALAERTATIDTLQMEQEAGRLRDRTQALQLRCENLNVKVGRLEALHAAAREAEVRARALANEREALGDALELQELGCRAFGRDGVPALLVENVAVPQIELEANRILQELGTDYLVELRTQRETKSGSVSEALDIIVSTPQGERPYETFSGGERTRLNLSLRIALARLLAHRRGAEVKLLAIDEPEFLDDDGVEQLARVLQGLASDFERIILISHMPALRDSFPQTIAVRRDGVSVLEESA